MSENNQSDEVSLVIETGKNGLWSFYSEGFQRWPHNRLAPLFSNRNLEETRIQQEFLRLEKEGFIKLYKTDVCYLEVLRTPSI